MLAMLALSAALATPAMSAMADNALEPASVANIVNGINGNELLSPSILAGSTIINTGTGGAAPTLVSGNTTYNGQLVRQSDGSTVAVFAFSGVVSATNVTVSGGSIPLVIYSTGNMSMGNLSVAGGVGGKGTIGNFGTAGIGGPGGADGGRGGSSAAYIGLASNGLGPGGGTGGGVEASGGGGGFGGAGGTGFVFPNAGPPTTPVPGGPAYGDLTSALTGGSGAGGGSGKDGYAGGGGGGGGGGIALIAGGTINVTGSINANGGTGGDGYYGGGGGSGGGVLIASLGSGGGIVTGSISADGGNSGSFPGYAGGGGGGGRVVEYMQQWNVTPSATHISTAGGYYISPSGNYTGASGPIAVFADSTYISSTNFLAIRGSGSATYLNSGAGYSVPLQFQTNAFTVNGNLTLNAASQTIATLNGTGTVTLINSNLILDPGLGVRFIDNTFNGVISGTGSITLSGPGQFALGGNNTYSGGTFINGGVLSITSSNALGSGALTFGGGTLDIPSNITLTNAISLNVTTGTNGIQVDGAGTNATLSGVISGPGSLTYTGGASTTVLNVTGANTYTGGTFINVGTLDVSGTGTLGTGLATVNSGATLNLDNAANLTVDGLAGAGTVNLEAAGVTIAPVAGAVDTFTGSIAGAQALTIGGTGTQILGGTDTYTGGTTIKQFATLLIATPASMATGNLINNGTFGQTGTNYNNIAIAGTYTQASTGYLQTRVAGSITGTFDRYTVNGTANIQGGINVVFENRYVPPGSNGSFVTLPILTATSITAGAINIILGNHPIDVFGSSTVTGGNTLNLVLTIEQPSLIPYATTPNQLAIATYLDSTDGYSGSTPSASYQTLINAIDGSYSNEIGGVLDMLTPIELQAIPQVEIQNSINLDQTFSQQAQLIDSGQRGWNSFALTMLQPGAQDAGQVALYQMLQNQAQVASLDDSMMGPMDQGYDPAQANQPPAGYGQRPRWGVFLSGALQYDNFSSTASDGSNPNVTTEGATVGADYAIAQPLTIGALFNYAHSDVNLDNSGSTARVDSYSPGVFVNFYKNHWFVDALGAYSFSNNSEKRVINIPPFSSVATGNFTGSAINASVDLGYRIFASNTQFNGMGGWTIVPMLSIGYTHSDMNSFSETGAGPAGLNVDSISTDSLRTTLSTQFLYRMVLSKNFAMQPGFMLGWRHEYLNDSQGITSQLQGAGTGSFTVNTISPTRDVAIFAPSLNLTIRKNITAFVDYELDLGSNKYNAQQVFAGVAIAF